jgi:hypothetical protein
MLTELGDQLLVSIEAQLLWRAPCGATRLGVDRVTSPIGLGSDLQRSDGRLDGGSASNLLHGMFTNSRSPLYDNLTGTLRAFLCGDLKEPA